MKIRVTVNPDKQVVVEYEDGTNLPSNEPKGDNDGVVVEVADHSKKKKIFDGINWNTIIDDVEPLFQAITRIVLCAALLIAIPYVETTTQKTFNNFTFTWATVHFSLVIIAVLYIFNISWLYKNLESQTRSTPRYITALITLMFFISFIAIMSITSEFNFSEMKTMEHTINTFFN